MIREIPNLALHLYVRRAGPISNTRDELESLDTGTAAGRLVLNVMASVSQWEREAIGERTRDALRHKKSQGSACSAFFADLRSSGSTLRGIAAELNAQGLVTRRS